jgi:hypothetical protein
MIGSSRFARFIGPVAGGPAGDDRRVRIFRDKRRQPTGAKERRQALPEAAIVERRERGRRDLVPQRFMGCSHSVASRQSKFEAILSTRAMSQAIDVFAPAGRFATILLILIGKISKFQLFRAISPR